MIAFSAQTGYADKQKCCPSVFRKVYTLTNMRPETGIKKSSAVFLTAELTAYMLEQMQILLSILSIYAMISTSENRRDDG